MTKEKMFDESISEEDRLAIQAALDGDDNFGEDHELEMAIQASLNIEKEEEEYITPPISPVKENKIILPEISEDLRFENLVDRRISKLYYGSTPVDLLDDLLGTGNTIQIKIMFLNREHQPLSIKVNSEIPFHQLLDYIKLKFNISANSMTLSLANLKWTDDSQRTVSIKDLGITNRSAITVQIHN